MEVTLFSKYMIRPGSHELRFTNEEFEFRIYSQDSVVKSDQYIKHRNHIMLNTVLNEMI